VPSGKKNASGGPAGGQTFEKFDKQVLMGIFTNSEIYSWVDAFSGKLDRCIDGVATLWAYQ